MLHVWLAENARHLRFLLFALTLFPTVGRAQIPDEQLPPPTEGELGPAMAINIQLGRAAYHGDSIPHIILPTLYKYPPLELNSPKERERYIRLVANVKKLLPLAKMVKITVIETYEYLETLPTKEARAEHIRAVEEGLKRQYRPVVENMSRSQGRLLVKLIDRECNMTGYNIAKAFIGAFKANLYQGISFFVGLNLNKHYDPEGDDRYTERVVRLVESGQI